jgi:hypothetical protein
LLLFLCGSCFPCVFSCCFFRINVEDLLTLVFSSFVDGACPYHVGVAFLVLMLPFSHWCYCFSHVCVVILLAFMLYLFLLPQVPIGLILLLFFSNWCRCFFMLVLLLFFWLVWYFPLSCPMQVGALILEHQNLEH